MSLDEYERMRDFAVTSEPRGKLTSKSGAAPIFVVQLHHARARHFDFRLQVGAKLASWAVPRGPSLRAGEKRLAVQVEDHPLDYAGFEGVIPVGSYGAGDVRIADHGTWKLEGDPAKAIAEGKLDFTLRGVHLGGAWKLIRTRTRGQRQQWLLIKRSDPFAADTDLDALVCRGAASPRVVAGASRWRDRALRLAGATQGAAAPALQLATPSTVAPEGDDWLHEVKWDGYRLLATRDGDQLRIASRNGTDWTGRFAHIETALLALPVRAFKLDGELVVLNARGDSDFAGLQRSLEGTSAAAPACVVFDLLQVEDVDITGVAQLERKLLLRALLAKTPSKHVRYSEHIVGHGPEVFASSQREGLEGIVSKRVDAPYLDGRSRRWLKVKHADGIEAVVVGYTAPQRSRVGLGALMLALREGKDWRHIGRVGTGMDDATLKALRTKLEAMKQDTPVLELPRHVALSPRVITWVEPRVVVEVEHRGWGKEGLLRHASFLRERPDESREAPPRRRAKSPVEAASHVRLSSPERRVFTSPAVTKQDVADYYRAVAAWMLPGIVGRPLSVLRAPNGVPGETFFQKHVGAGFGDAVRTIPVRAKSGRVDAHLRIDDVRGLLQLVQMNALEFHPWGVHEGEVEQPDRVVFDLDPGRGVTWSMVIEAARAVRGTLAELGLESFPMVSGGKGVHVVAPLGGGHDWAHVKAFSQAIAQLLEQREPGRYVASASKHRRGGRIFIDWLRNARGATSIAAWSLRARPGAKVAVPVRWGALSQLTGADHFTLARAKKLAAALKRHPWGDFRALGQELPLPT